MPYIAPYIDSSGMHIPTYNDILENLINQMKAIFGEDIYIDEDSMDYQQISIFAKKIYDSYSTALMVYNNRTPITAIGTNLDNLCALVGIVRKPATKSEVILTVTGDPGTVITDGQALDVNGNLWDLPSAVTIPGNGTINVNSTSNKASKVEAAANTITTIATPVYGWLSVVNNYAANPGSNIESDAELRARYAVSTMLPSQTVLDGLIASVEAVNGVTRIKGYENDTNVTSDEGFPPHSTTLVVEGGTNGDVANAYISKKTPGVYTNGTTSVTLISESGNATIIRFYRPTYVSIKCKIYLQMLAGYNSQSEDDIKQAVVSYIAKLGIAENVYSSLVTSVALSQLGNINVPSFAITSVKFSTDGGTTYNLDSVEMAFNEVASMYASDITIEVS